MGCELQPPPAEVPMLNLQICDGHHKVFNAIAPNLSRCPRCRAWAERNEIRKRLFWVPDLHAASIVEVRAGCYICPRCPIGQQWFMLLPAEFKTLEKSVAGPRNRDFYRKHGFS